jgi:diaminopimelate epimerase
MKKLKFVKFVAAGNDFVIINNFDKKISPKTYSELAKKLCRQKFSIGADGLLIIEPTIKSNCEFRMVYYNSDGSRASMCGNGARCIAYYAYELELCDDIVNFETDAGIITAEIKRGEKVKIKLTEPTRLKLDFFIKLDSGKELSINFVDTGVPHSVIFVNEIEKVDVKNLGREIRYNKLFMPEGTNVNFGKVIDKNNLVVRKFERGVEDETLSCGTGVTACSVISAAKNLVVSPVNCKTQSGEILTISFTKNDPEDMLSPVSNLYLEGKVYHIFDGEIII